MLMWVMSDRAIPRSYRMMQGFGVHTFRLVNAKGESVFFKFHWSPIARHAFGGVGRGGQDLAAPIPISIAATCGKRSKPAPIRNTSSALQVFTEEQAEEFSFDVLDATKIVPEELVPLRPVGRMVLNRNPDNFFAETEQVAFCTRTSCRASTSATTRCCRAAIHPTSTRS